MNLARCTPADEILVAYVTDMTMQKKVMTKKRSSDFWSGKVHPRRENPGYAYARSRGRGFESRPGTRGKNSGQVSHTYVPLSPSSISWYRPKGGDALRLGSKGRYGSCEIKLCDPLVTHGHI